MLICLPCFIIVLIFLWIAYNLTGVITEDGFHDELVIPVLADLAKPGEMLDAEGNVAILAGIVQALLTNQLNMVFREIATWLTDRENHKYQSDYDQALILKRFVFEFFDCFFPLIYLGWWDLNFKVLRANVISVYTADEIRRIITESLIPYLMQMSSRKEIQAN